MTVFCSAAVTDIFGASQLVQVQPPSGFFHYFNVMLLGNMDLRALALTSNTLRVFSHFARHGTSPIVDSSGFDINFRRQLLSQSGSVKSRQNRAGPKTSLKDTTGDLKAIDKRGDVAMVSQRLNSSSGIHL